MLKTLITILILIIFITIGVKFNLFTPSSTPKTKPLVVIPVVPKENTEENQSIIKTIITQEIPIIKENNNSSNPFLTQISKLINKANLLFQSSKDNEAIELYLQIIEKSKDSNDPKILIHFAKASLQLAFLYQIYPNNDKEASIEVYQNLIDKLENATQSGLLEQYINAKIQQSYLFDNDERMDIYDELISRFKNHKNKDLQAKIEDLLINKSFDLMGKDDEGAMQILDTLIDKYEKQGIKKLPEEIEIAILNNLELSIITNNDDEKYIELANKYLSDSPDTKPLLDMLEIIKNAQDLNQDEALAEWKNNYGDYRFGDWSFQEVRRWINNVEDTETRDRVIKYINAFEDHKNNIDSQERSRYQQQDNGTMSIDISQIQSPNNQSEGAIEENTIELEPSKYIMSEEEQIEYQENQEEEENNPYSEEDLY